MSLDPKRSMIISPARPSPRSRQYLWAGSTWLPTGSQNRPDHSLRPGGSLSVLHLWISSSGVRLPFGNCELSRGRSTLVPFLRARCSFLPRRVYRGLRGRCNPSLTPASYNNKKYL
jgi:hypothetical protein